LPHQYCLAGDSRLLWTFAITDLTIGMSYLVIAGTIAWLLRQAKGKLPFAGSMWAFGAFITRCGATHFLEVITLWKPVYWLSAVVKILTAAASAGTCFALIFYARTILNFILEKSDIALLRGNERFRALVQAAPLAVIGADIEGQVTSWNPSAERIFGWKKEEVLGRFAKSIPPDKKEEVFQLLARTVAGQVTTGFESVRITREGERLPVSISTAPIYDETGKLTGIMVTQEDIRERKRIERELEEKSATLAAVTHALNVFLESGDWSRASQHLLSFALQQTQSEYGFLGVVLEGPVLRVLAHDGIRWDERLARELYESKMKQYANEGYFELVHELEVSLIRVLLHLAFVKLARESFIPPDPVVRQNTQHRPLQHHTQKAVFALRLLQRKGKKVLAGPAPVTAFQKHVERMRDRGQRRGFLFQLPFDSLTFADVLLGDH